MGRICGSGADGHRWRSCATRADISESLQYGLCAGCPPLRLPSLLHAGSSHFSPEGAVQGKLLGSSATPPSAQPCPLLPTRLSWMLSFVEVPPPLWGLQWPLDDPSHPLASQFFGFLIPKDLVFFPPPPSSPISCHGPGHHPRVLRLARLLMHRRWPVLSPCPLGHICCTCSFAASWATCSWSPGPHTQLSLRPSTPFARGEVPSS